MSQIELHSENFDLCRICLLEPEADRNVKFTRIFPVDDEEDCTLHRDIEDIFGIKIEKDCIKPKLICQNCLQKLIGFLELKKLAAESKIIIKRFAKSGENSTTTTPSTSNARPNSSRNSNNEEKPIRVKLERNKTENVQKTPLPSTYIATTPSTSNARPNSSLNSNNEEKPIRVKLERNNTENVQKMPLPSTYKLFTCLKPSCNLIYQSFETFKLHYRRHFGYEDKVMCWLCCVPFSSVSKLRSHQMSGICHTTGKFECYECSEKFDDLEGLSIHKFTFHDSNFVGRNNIEKTIMCAFCEEEIVIHSFKEHLLHFH